MDNFSSLLEKTVKNNNLTLIQLSANTGIERSTLYQYLNGKRRLKSKEHFDRIMRQLTLSVTERRELEAAWEIQLHGEEIWLQKQYLEHFFKTLPSVEQAFSKMQSSEYSITPTAVDRAEGTRCVIGRAAAADELFSSLCAAGKDAQVTVMAQPNSDFIERLLIHPAVYRAGIRLTLIARLSRSRNEQYQNLPVMEQIMRIFSVFPDYVPLCYYSETDDSRSAVLPQNLILTDRTAVLIADDGVCALVTEDRAMLDHLKKSIDSIREYCVPIGKSFSGQIEEMSYLLDLFQRIDFTSRYELSGSFCTTPFFTEDIIRRNINPAHPQREELTAYFSRMLGYLRKCKEENPGTILSSVSAMTDFARTGVVQDVPKYLIPAPLPPEDRLTILTAIRGGIIGGWYHLRLFREGNIMLDRRWDVMSCPSVFCIELFCADGNRYFEFTEHTLLNIFTQYLQNILTTDKVTTEEETLTLLGQEIDRLREELAGG